MSPAMPRSVPTANLTGFSNMTAIMAFCATKPTHQGGAYKL